MTMKDEQWRAALAVNLDGVFYCCREAIRHMRKGGGSIINISSVAAFAAQRRAGQLQRGQGRGAGGTDRSLALEYGSRGIRVNAVVPGIIETAMTGVVKPELREAWLKQIRWAAWGSRRTSPERCCFWRARTLRI